jgi:hypothetical protein
MIAATTNAMVIQRDPGRSVDSLCDIEILQGCLHQETKCPIGTGCAVNLPHSRPLIKVRVLQVSKNSRIPSQVEAAHIQAWSLKEP